LLSSSADAGVRHPDHAAKQTYSNVNHRRATRVFQTPLPCKKVLRCSNARLIGIDLSRSSSVGADSEIARFGRFSDAQIHNLRHVIPAVETNQARFNKDKPASVRHYSQRFN